MGDSLVSKPISFLFLKFLNGYQQDDLTKVKEEIENNFKTQKSNEIQVKDQKQRSKILGSYHLFGLYDLLIIKQDPFLAINNRAFTPNLVNTQAIISTHLLAGLTLLEPSERNIGNNNFISITQFKLNSDYLFGDTKNFIEYLKIQINEIIENVIEQNRENNKKLNIDAIINFSFSPYELTVCLLSTCLYQNCLIIGRIRSLNIKDKVTFKKLNKYYSVFNKKYKLDRHPPLISDSQSYYGIKVNVEDNRLKFTSLVDLDDRIKFSIDFTINPGRLKDVYEHLDKITQFKSSQTNTIKFVAGRTDVESIEFTNIQFKELFENINGTNEHNIESINSIRSCIREMTTNIIFEINRSEIKSLPSFCSNEKVHIDHFYFSNEKIKEIDRKCINKNYSTQLTSKIKRMYDSYNTGIINDLTYNLFLDLFYYLNYFFYNFENFNLEKVNSFIQSYESAYYVRHLHESTTDQNNEMFLGYNMSLQGLISDIDSIFKLVACELLGFYISMEPEILENSNFIKTYSSEEIYFIAYFDSHITSANGHSVNFNIQSIFYPEILFVYIIKESTVAIDAFFKGESLDPFYFDKIDSAQIRAHVQVMSKRNYLFADYGEVICNQPVYYYIQDYLKYITLFEDNFDCYVNLKLLILYQDIDSLMERKEFYEEHLIKELLRLLFIAHIASVDTKSYKVNQIVLENYNNLIRTLILKYAEKEGNEFFIAYANIFVDLLENFWKSFYNMNNYDEQLIGLISIKKDWIAYKTNAKTINVLKNHITKFCNDFKAGDRIKVNRNGGFYISDGYLEKYHENSMITSLSLSELCSKYKFELVNRIIKKSNLK